jgi:hypothetical protein
MTPVGVASSGTVVGIVVGFVRFRRALVRVEHVVTVVVAVGIDENVGPSFLRFGNFCNFLRIFFLDKLKK